MFIQVLSPFLKIRFLLGFFFCLFTMSCVSYMFCRLNCYRKYNLQILSPILCVLTRFIMSNMFSPMGWSPQAPSSMGFSGQGHRNGLHLLLQGIFQHRIKPASLESSAPPSRLFTTRSAWDASHSLCSLKLEYSWDLYVGMACSVLCCYYSVTKSCPALCDPINCCTSGFPVLHCLPEFVQTHAHWVSGDILSSILCHPLLHLLSVFPSIRVFSNKSILSIRWPECWRFGFSISSSSE